MANFIKDMMKKLKLIEEDEEEIIQEEELLAVKKPKTAKEPEEIPALPKRGKIVNIHTTTQLKVVVVQP